eukprot:658122-Ditylum_brightwellii.AAC.1
MHSTTNHSAPLPQTEEQRRHHIALYYQMIVITLMRSVLLKLHMKMRKQELHFGRSKLTMQMLAWCPPKTNTGHLPNIKFTESKPEPVGTEFKCICCAITGIMLALQIQR